MSSTCFLFQWLENVDGIENHLANFIYLDESFDYLFEWFCWFGKSDSHFELFKFLILDSILLLLI